MTLEILLAVSAIILTVALFWKHDKDIRVLNTNIKIVNDQIPTRYIAKFPDNFHEIIKIIKEANKSIKIVSDVPAYGIFSSPNSYWEFRNCLQKQKGNRCEIILVVYDKKQIDNSLTEQFINADKDLYISEKALNFYKILKNNFSALELEFWAKYSEIILTKSLKSNAELLTLLADLHQAEMKVFKGWQIKVEEKTFPNEIFYWIVDDSNAIFSILNESLVDSEASFYTRDRNFIEILNENFRNKIEKISTKKH